jgi:hypothetical protein
VASGEAIRFRSVKQLVDFMVGMLRRRAGAALERTADRGIEPLDVTETKTQRGGKR